MKLNLGAGDKPLEGFINLDARDGWRFEDGLGDYADGSVDGITISHALMYVPLLEWPAVFSEFARVLAADGVIRITEDDTFNPKSERHGGHYDAVTLTDPALVRDHLRASGFKQASLVLSDKSDRDESLIQNWHGDPPKVFHVEATRP